MTRVLVITSPIRQTQLVDALTQFRAAGASVAVVCNFDSSGYTMAAELAELHPLPTRRAQMSRRAADTRPAKRLWAKIRDDAWVRNSARQADVIVALDHLSIHAVWELAQRYRRPDTIYGVAPGLRAIVARRDATTARHARSVAAAVPARGGALVRDVRTGGRMSIRRIALAAVSTTAMRSDLVTRAWTAALAAPKLSDGLRGKIATKVHGSMMRAGREQQAADSALEVATRVSEDRVKADLLMRAARLEIALNYSRSLREAVIAKLRVADRAYRKKEYRRSAKDLRAVMRLLFHRGLHFDGVSSPLADDPADFLGGWRASRAARVLSKARGRDVPLGTPPVGRPLRLLIVTIGNHGVLRAICDHYEAMADVEVRFVDLGEDPRTLDEQDQSVMIEHLLAGDRAYVDRLEEWLGGYLDWADTLFVDWCVSPAVLFTMLDSRDARVIVRLHSFETFTPWPHLVDFSRVDDIIFVSEHLREVTNDIVPHLALRGTRQHVLANAMDLQSFVRPKQDDARFTLGLVGIGGIAKDPRWAIDVLRILRTHDERYRLMLMGELLEGDTSGPAGHYHELLLADLAELEPTGAVVRLGYVTDVPKALEEVGVIISSSVRESFHCALVEGAASGAVPVVRDWPFFAHAHKEHGARTLFPTDWVVETPEEAAARILETNASPQSWRAAGAAAAEYALTHWDWSVVRRDFDTLLLPGAGRQ
jgi:glycosyltransferase involved in cell wall biosynthesis